MFDLNYITCSALVNPDSWTITFETVSHHLRISYHLGVNLKQSNFSLDFEAVSLGLTVKIQIRMATSGKYDPSVDYSFGIVLIICVVVGGVGNSGAVLYFWKKRRESFPDLLYFFISACER